MVCSFQIYAGLNIFWLPVIASGGSLHFQCHNSNTLSIFIQMWCNIDECVTGGFMEDLDEKWIKQGNVQQCENDEKTPATLGLKNMAGIFILVAAAIVGGVGLIVIEIMYKRHQIRRQRRLELARHAADKWRTVVEVFPFEFKLFNISIHCGWHSKKNDDIKSRFYGAQ